VVTTQIPKTRGYLVIAVSIGEEAVDNIALVVNISLALSGSSRQFFTGAATPTEAIEK